MTVIKNANVVGCGQYENYKQYKVMDYMNIVNNNLLTSKSCGPSVC